MTTEDFLLPDVGEGLEEATIVEWLVEIGSPVALNQPLCIIETAKAEVDLPAPFAGTLVARHGEPGDTLAVGTVLARFAVPDRTPAAATPAVLVGYGVAEPPPPTRAPALRRPGAGDPAVQAKPPVRKLARDLGVDLAALAPGTGPEGRVTRDDVLAAAGPREGTGPRPAGGTIPLTGVRGRMAERMAQTRSIPMASCAVWADATRLLAVRDDLQRRAGVRLTPFAVLLRLLVEALGQHPLLNSRLDEERRVIHLLPEVHLGVATDTDRGLAVVVVRDARRRTLVDLAAEVETLITAAREGRATPAQLSGSTVTVSNFGALDVDEGTPVVNPPEAAIVGVGALRPRPVALDGQLMIRTTVRLSCTFDHRILDGAAAARFLGDLRALVEEPARALLTS
jgi:2-oxoisovalerate dehydrogenase E2 component (dihydrolipoyl transacylase)